MTRKRSVSLPSDKLRFQTCLNFFLYFFFEGSRYDHEEKGAVFAERRNICPYMHLQAVLIL